MALASVFLGFNSMTVVSSSRNSAVSFWCRHHLASFIRSSDHPQEPGEPVLISLANRIEDAFDSSFGKIGWSRPLLTEHSPFPRRCHPPAAH